MSSYSHNGAMRQFMNCRVLILVLFLGLPLLVAPYVSAAEVPKRVLIFTSEHQHIPAVEILNQAIFNTMGSRLPTQVQFFYEAQDNFRIPNEKYEAELVGLMRRKYEGEHIDLIFVYAPPAIRFLVKHRDELFTNTPIVFMSVDPERLADLELDQNVTGVGTKLELKPTLDVALALQPETKE